MLLKQHVKKLQHKLVNQENVFQGFRAKMTLEIRERKKLLRNMDERIEAIEVSRSGSGHRLCTEPSNPRKGWLEIKAKSQGEAPVSCLPLIH